MSKDTGGTAFPETDQRLNVATGNYIPILRSGLTIRDYFAAKAMQADLEYQGLEGREDLRHIAGMAYQMADAMIAERNKEKS